MQKLDFAEAVTILTEADTRYQPDAYYFLRDVLDHTVKLQKRQSGETGHVSGQQLCEGARQLALKYFGPMVPTVFGYWGIRKTGDLGEMVWNLIDLGVFGKTDGDSRSDFKDVFNFEEAFVAPFLPSTPPARAIKPKAHQRVQP